MIKKLFCAALPAMVFSTQAFAQFSPGVDDAYSVTQNDMRGTARFMSMGGAFGALGGDLTTLTQNPAGLGVYRSSEIAITLDVDFQSTQTTTPFAFNASQTKVYVNNFGYAGTMNLDGPILRNINWGATYNRRASFDRVYGGQFMSLQNSLSDFIAQQATAHGYPTDILGYDDKYDPFLSWPTSQYGPMSSLSILAYNAYVINPQGNNKASYSGLFSPGSTTGNSMFEVRERGYIDEYSLNFGGNIMDKLYWGIGVGITDLNYTLETYYDEELSNAVVSNQAGTAMGVGAAYFNLENYKRISGSGYNIKLGLIFKPINELRLGVAFHTPTWYSMNQSYDAYIDYAYKTDNFENTNYAELGYPIDMAYKLRTPWKVMISAAAVVGGKFIVSADYERDQYNTMQYSTDGIFQWTTFPNNELKSYYKAVNTFRLGAEYRVTPQFSLRAGYSYSGDNVAVDANSYYPIGTELSGTNPAYTLNKATQYYTCGIGYRFSKVYLDAAFVHRNRNSEYYPFTGSKQVAGVEQNNNNLVLSLGYKF